MSKKYIFVGYKESQLHDDMYMKFNKLIIEKNLQDKVKFYKSEMFGLETYNSILKIYPDEVVYLDLTPEKMEEMVESHLVNNKIVEDSVYKGTDLDYINTKQPFYHKQYRVVLRNSGIINPESIEEYIQRDGYKGLVKAITEYKQDDIIEQIKISGLRGRGGGGFPTWMKWNFSKQVESDQKYIVCNADEGDPGAYMDRSVLEGDPHSVVEGMAIAGAAVGANKGFIYCRAEYPLAISRLEIAIKDAREAGLLGDNILGTKFSFDIEVRLGAGAFVCGEETALLASIEGNRGMPRPRPPFPAVKGLWGKPTVINNVETFANVPFILYKGGNWYSKIGTEKSKGTKVFALTGKVKYSGLVEVPMGTPIKDIVFDMGGGILNNKGFKAVQTGGPSGGVIPPKYVDTPISYESLLELGSIMGSGGMIVMDDTDCIVDVAKFYLQFTVDESCGKCSPCRLGGKQLLGALESITNGTADENIISTIKSIATAMQKASLCGLGQTSPNPVVSTLKYFEDEYMAHIKDKKCPAGVCKDLITYTIDPDKCIGCTLCAKRCPVPCITGSVKQPHVIDQSQCVKCGECYSVCKFGAVKIG